MKFLKKTELRGGIPTCNKDAVLVAKASSGLPGDVPLLLGDAVTLSGSVSGICGIFREANRNGRIRNGIISNQFCLRQLKTTN